MRIGAAKITYVYAYLLFYIVPRDRFFIQQIRITVVAEQCVQYLQRINSYFYFLSSTEPPHIINRCQFYECANIVECLQR